MGQRKYQDVVWNEAIEGSYEDNFKPIWNNKIRCDESALYIPLKWRKPRRIFVCSMSDLFHPKVPFAFVDKVMFTIYKSYDMGHTFQILTKRAKRMLKYFLTNSVNLLPRVHLGVSISNQTEADEKIPILLQIPAAVQWLSIEPMLGPIDLLNCNGVMAFGRIYGAWIDGVVVGGESGPGARPMHPDWVRSIRDQCVAADVPFFFKQWGRWGIAEPIPNDRKKRFRVVGGTEPISPNTIFKIFPEHAISTIPLTGWVKVGKKKAGRTLDGREWNEYPERS